MSEIEAVLSRALPRMSGGAVPRGASAVLSLLDRLVDGSVDMALPDGQSLRLGRGVCAARVQIREWGMFDAILGKGDIGLAEAYIDGLWEADDLPAFLALLVRNREVLARAVYGNALRLIACRIGHLMRANTRGGSRRNIMAHYDLGNSFYEAWLDPSMSYSAALFEGDFSRPFDYAQRAKYRRILDQLDPKPGQTILEIGCGWGGLAEVAAHEYGLNVLGLTLSPAQLEYARRRAASRGFDDRARFELCDYRDVRGRFDHIVSIEMFEAVGERYWPTYFSQVRNCLKPGGRAAIQVITIDDALFSRYRRGTDFLQRYVFPGGMLPSPSVFRARAAERCLAVAAEHRFGHDYAHTLSLWARRFEAQLSNVRALGFGDDFIRLWRFYLAYCEAAFRAGSTDVFHFTLEHAA